MTEAKLTPRGRLDPSVEAIRRELIRIRGQKEALGEEAVIDHGEHLQQLAAVDDEVARRDLPPGMRPEATVSVTKCAVNRLVHEPWRTSLLFTLVDPDDESVEARKEAARLKLGIVSTSERDKVDEKSYRDLARRLVEAQASPCRGDDLARANELIATIRAAVAELAIVHSALGIDVSADDERRVARRLEAVLPRGVRALSGQEPVARVAALLGAAVQAHDGILREAQYLPAPLLLFRLVGTVTAVAGTEFDDSGDEEVQQLEIVDLMDELWERESSLPGFDGRLAQSLIFVVDALAYEERHDWPSLREPRIAEASTSDSDFD